MAITQIHAIETTLSKAIDYISDPAKTENKILISAFGCTPEMAAKEFEYTKRAADKQGGKLAYHVIQSFAPGEVDYFTAHEIGKQLADKHLKGEHEYIISTHNDRGNIHNHIIFNSVPTTGKRKYRSTMPSYFKMREISDKLCEDYNLSVIEPSGDKGKCYKEHTADKQGMSWKSALRETIDRCMKQAHDWDEFLKLMEAEKHEIKHGKHISFRAEGQERFTRAKTLGNRYTEQNIKAQLSGQRDVASNTRFAGTKQQNINLLIDIDNSIKAKQAAGYKHWAKMKNLKIAAMTINYLSDNGLLAYKNLTAKHDEIKNKRDNSLENIKTIEKRIKELNAQIKDLDTYRKAKPIVEKLDTVIFKEKYKRENETDFILFNAAKQSLKAHFPDNKFPLIKTLRAEINELYDEKNKLYSEYYTAKDELLNISNIKKNVDLILEPEQEQTHERERKARNKSKDLEL
ncbi:MAG: relaxase/mobilization nuclease domain-containing protein [Oscillospiraceae bacterium]|jgi:hypothetical protein|nr:relaxase/mobilization nuclease domain-containing protein [Oscillospiraceae bacterium]